MNRIVLLLFLCICACATGHETLIFADGSHVDSWCFTLGSARCELTRGSTPAAPPSNATTTADDERTTPTFELGAWRPIEAVATPPTPNPQADELSIVVGSDHVSPTAWGFLTAVVSGLPAILAAAH